MLAGVGRETVMDTTSYIALSRQIALQRALGVVANNVANLATTGFKAQSVLFETVLERAGEPRTLAFVQDVATVQDPSPGPILPTGAPFDLAIQGPGWLTVQTPAGERYTRAGQLLRNARGELVTPDGHPVLDEGGRPIVVPASEGAPTIAADGTISGRSGVLGRIRLVSFTAPERLRPEGSGLLATDEPPIPGAPGSLVQGALEGSNVKGVLEITRLIEITRAFEGTQKMLDTHHELTRRAVERLGSVNA
jgi:flagellar basal-body rod protein FlgF